MKNNSLLLIFGFAASLFACDPINEISETVTQDDQLGLNIPSGFDFSTTSSVNIDLSAKGSDNALCQMWCIKYTKVTLIKRGLYCKPYSWTNKVVLLSL